MFKLTKNQKKELIVLEYFTPSNIEWGEKNDDDIKRYFEWSEKGLHKKDVTMNTTTIAGRSCFHRLYWSKVWAGRHIHELYEPGILEGVFLGYYSILGGDDGNPVPLEVAEFMSKELFKGIDKSTIMDIYNNILQKHLV